MRRNFAILVLSTAAVAQPLSGGCKGGGQKPAEVVVPQASTKATALPGAPTSRVERTAAGELILAQELTVRASLDDVWAAYTTAAGWMAWVAPVAEVDLRAGGSIFTHYTATSAIGDPGTIELTIVNYIPKRLLTLQVADSRALPEFARVDVKNLFNVILFEPQGPAVTRILSYGVGYRDTPEYNKMLEFFIGSNEGALNKLKMYLEKP